MAAKEEGELAICPGNLSGKQSGETRKTHMLSCLSSSVVSTYAVRSYSTGSSATA